MKFIFLFAFRNFYFYGHFILGDIILTYLDISFV